MKGEIYKADIIENAIRKSKQLEAVGGAIACLGENHDKNQFLESYGEQMGDVVRDLAEEIRESLEQNQELILSNAGQRIKGSSPLQQRDEEPENGSFRSGNVLRVAHG